MDNKETENSRSRDTQASFKNQLAEFGVENWRIYRERGKICVQLLLPGGNTLSDLASIAGEVGRIFASHVATFANEHFETDEFRQVALQSSDIYGYKIAGENTQPPIAQVMMPCGGLVVSLEPISYTPKGTDFINQYTMYLTSCFKSPQDDIN